MQVLLLLLGMVYPQEVIYPAGAAAAGAGGGTISQALHPNLLVSCNALYQNFIEMSSQQLEHQLFVLFLKK